MKTRTNAGLNPTTLRFALFLSAVMIFGAACRKDQHPVGEVTPDPAQLATDTIQSKSVADLTQTLPFPESGSVNCTYSPDYGGSLLQPQPTNGKDYTVSPLNNKSVAGTYLAWPGGLVIDPHTGTINFTRSETGANYAVAFVRSGSTDTCLTYITLAGADYKDSVYSAQISPKSAAPHFNGNVAGPNPCGGSKCKFDYNHYAKDQGVYIDGNNGTIDLKNTLDHSLFHLFPVDGMYFYTTIQYKVNDGSNNAPQAIQVKFVYYNYRSSVPASLTQTVDARAESINTGDLKSLSTVRPPIIVITRFN